MTIRLFVDDIEYIPQEEKAAAVKIEMWYDRSRRNWVLYPVDEEGNQLAEAMYGFGKAEAMEIKKELELEYGIKK